MHLVQKGYMLCLLAAILEGQLQLWPHQHHHCLAPCLKGPYLFFFSGCLLLKRPIISFPSLREYNYPISLHLLSLFKHLCLYATKKIEKINHCRHSKKAPQEKPLCILNERKIIMKKVGKDPK